MRGCPVVSSLFSSGLAPQVGQRTACTRLTFGFLAFMVIDGAANSHIRVGISCTATHRIEIVDARQTPQAARPKLHSAAASEVLAQIKTATAKIANPSSHIRSRRRGWIGSRCAGCRTEACSLRSGSGDLASLKRGRLGYLWVGRSLTRGSIVEARAAVVSGSRFEVLVTILLLFSSIIRPVLAAVDFVNHRRTSSQQL